MSGDQRPFGFQAMPPVAGLMLRLLHALPASRATKPLAILMRRGIRWQLPDEVDAMIGGMKLRAEWRDNISDRELLFFPQFYEREELAMLASRMPPSPIVVDLGANVGLFTMMIAQLRPSLSGLAIEPNPACVSRLRFHLEANGLADKMQVAAAAAGDVPGIFSLTVPADNLGGASLNGDLTTGSQVNVPVRLLLDMITEAGLQRIDLLKADVEGFEDRAIIPFLEQAPSALKPELILLEENPGRWHRDLAAFLAANGYERIEKHQANGLWRRISKD